MAEPGTIVILNGAPRSGKSSIVRVIQETFDGPWMNLGVDVFVRHVTPPRYRPGMGLRPGAERPEIERLVPALYTAFYESIAAHSRQGLNVVADVGHHDDYSSPLHVLRDAAERLRNLPVLFVGVRCPLGTIMERRETDEAAGDDPLATAAAASHGGIPEAVLGWQDEVHIPGVYDLEVDTSVMSPEQCAAAIRKRLTEGPVPTAFEQLAQHD